MNVGRISFKLLVVILLLFSCAEEKDFVRRGLTVFGSPLHQEGDKTNILFQIKDINGNWIKNAKITILSSSEELYTDDRGLAALEDEFLLAYGLPYKVEMDGFLPHFGIAHGSIYTAVGTDPVNFSNELILLKPKGANTLTETGATLELDEFTLTIPHQLIQKDGESYSGVVELYIQDIDISTPKKFGVNALSSTLGSMKNGESRIVESLSFFYLELFTEEGEELGIYSDFPMLISTPINNFGLELPNYLRSFTLNSFDALWNEQDDAVLNTKGDYELALKSTGYATIALSHAFSTQSVSSNHRGIDDAKIILCRSEDGPCFCTVFDGDLISDGNKNRMYLPRDIELYPFVIIEDDLIVPEVLDYEINDKIRIWFGGEYNGYHGRVVCNPFATDQGNKWLIAKMEANDQVHYDILNSSTGFYDLGTREKGRINIRIEDYYTGDSVAELEIETGPDYSIPHVGYEELPEYIYCK